MSALYIGIKDTERELIQILDQRMNQEPPVEMTLLFDYTRGNREEMTPEGSKMSSKQLLLPLVQKNARISYYLSPHFSSWILKRFLLPIHSKNEIIELQHMKCFVFDDNVIISGANLSDQYFRNRNDRYFLFSDNKPLADYFDQLVQSVSSFSMQLDATGKFCLDKSWSHDPLEISTKLSFITDARKRVDNVQTKFSVDLDELTRSDGQESFVMPFIQMKTYELTDDQTFTRNILKSAPHDAILKLASGYFNLTQEYSILLLKRPPTSPCDVLIASEEVNSFFKAKGMIRFIPSFYTTMAKQFFTRLESVKKTADAPSLRLWSFYKPKWTFHTKGLWIHDLRSNLMLTTIGSPNFGYRSVNRDLEVQLVLVTSDQELKERLTTEYDDVWQSSSEIKSQSQFPKVPFWVQIISNVIKDYF